MKQLISRIDDDLHRRLKEQAAQEGRSLNEFVAGLLADAVDDAPTAFRRRLAASDLRVLPPPPSDDGGVDALSAGGSEVGPAEGDAVLDALRAERDSR